MNTTKRNCARSFLSIWLVFIIPPQAVSSRGQTSTTITISSTVLRPDVKRFGMNLGWINYFDSGQLMKELVFRNPGFEPQIYRSIVRAAAGTTASFTDDNTTTGWTNGFWNGAAFEVIWGTAKGRTGIVTSSSAPSAGTGITYQLAQSGIAPSPGDFVILRKTFSGDATAGWTPNVSGGGVIADETADLPPGSSGRQAVRLTAANPGSVASLSAFFDTSMAGTFLQLKGRYRLSFKAKGIGGANMLNCSVARLAPANLVYVNQLQTLSNSWRTFQIDFVAAENGTARGFVQVQFRAANQSALLLDEVSLVQTDGDSNNPTAFRDPVLAALREYNPGILRYSNTEFGDTLDNQISPVFGRLRSGFSARSSSVTDIQFGLHEFLELCETVGAEPWYSVPTTFSTNEMVRLIEYLAGPGSTEYGARRAERGHSPAWTDSFPRIHLEFGNEVWNGADYNGETILNPTAHGNRANELFGAAKQSPYFISGRLDLVLGGQAAFPARSAAIHAGSTNHDTFAVAPYFGGRIDNFGNIEDLFGPLFAEPEWLDSSSTGYMQQQLAGLQSSSRPVPLAVYEVNLHTTDGSISQAALNSFTPSLGAGLAVADHMLLMLRDLGVKDQLLHSLGQYANARTDGKYVLLWGAVRDMGVTDRKRPQFLALELANEALAGNMLGLALSGDNPTWAQRPINGVQSAPPLNVHYLQAHAFDNRGARSLIVFNLHRTAPLAIDFAGPNAPAGTVAIKRLGALNITDSNEDANNVGIARQTVANFNPAAPFSLPPFSMTLLQWDTRVGTAPRIVSQPQSQSVVKGGSVTLTIAASGDALSYQWQRNGIPVPGATGSSLALSNADRGVAGRYSVLVTNSSGSVTSEETTVRVLVPQRLWLPEMLPNFRYLFRFGDSDGAPSTLDGAANFEVQTSTDLARGNWVKASNSAVTFANGLFQVEVSARDDLASFFRVIEKP